MATYQLADELHAIACDAECGAIHEPADRVDAASAHGAAVSAARAGWAVSAMGGQGMVVVIWMCPACKVPIAF